LKIGKLSIGMNALPRRLDARSQKKENRSIVRYIVVGGGIAGVCCAQEIARLKKHDSIEVVIITATELLKESAGVMKITNHLEELSVFERTADRFSLDNPGIRVIHGSILSIDTSNKIVRLKDDSFFIYEKLCICTGAQPKMIATHPNIIGIRDLQSVAEMTERLSIARKVIIVGNGGIALEVQ
jgi:NADPH-dependent 2,4-dienoyl-CoA reductase/sulfur reductase-like enzyme